MTFAKTILCVCFYTSINVPYILLLVPLLPLPLLTIFTFVFSVFNCSDCKTTTYHLLLQTAYPTVYGQFPQLPQQIAAVASQREGKLWHNTSPPKPTACPSDPSPKIDVASTCMKFELDSQRVIACPTLPPTPHPILCACACLRRPFQPICFCTNNDDYHF